MNRCPMGTRIPCPTEQNMILPDKVCIGIQIILTILVLSLSARCTVTEKNILLIDKLPAVCLKTIHAHFQ